MKLFLCCAAGSVLLAFGTPAAADAATLSVDKACYVEGDPVTFTGSAFTPLARWEIEALAVFAAGDVAPDGTFSTVQAAPINPNEDTSAKTITVNAHQVADDGTNPVVASVSFKDVSLEAQAKSGAGNPRGFTRWGFSGFAPGKAIYMHVKRGSHMWTQRAGKGNRPCGILHTRLRRLPAVPASALHSGKYKITVDNHRKAGPGGRRYVIPYQIF